MLRKPPRLSSHPNVAAAGTASPKRFIAASGIMFRGWRDCRCAGGMMPAIAEASRNRLARQQTTVIFGNIHAGTLEP